MVLSEQIEQLRKLIIDNKTGKNNFIVFGLEAGLGKSVESTKIIKNFLQFNLKNHNFLIVKRFNEDVERTAKELPFSLGITNINWGKHKNNLSELKKYNAIVISHERYIRLSLKPELRKFFENNRQTLIIDELVLPPISTFNENRYREIQEALPVSYHEDLIKLCKPLFTKIAEFNSNDLQKCKVNIHPKTLERFIRKIEMNNWGENFHIIDKFMFDIQTIYSNKCICNKKSISTHNKDIWYWGLENNIILDANATTDYRYNLAPNIKIAPQDKFIDHSTTTFHKVNFNSSKNNIERTSNYFEVIKKEIKKYQKPDSKTLIVTKEDFEKEIVLPNCAVTYFGNLVGKNDWRDFNQVWVITTPIYPMETYVEYWKMFTGKELHRQSLKIEKGKFKNKEFEKIRQGCIVSETYQALKRINRDNSQSAEMFVVNNNEFIIRDIIQQMKNIKRGEDIFLPEIKYKTETEDKKNKVDELVEVLLNLPPETYSKGDIVKMINVSPANLNKLLNNKKIDKLLKLNLIEINHHTILVH